MFQNRLSRRKTPKPLPMHPNNVLIISSSAKELDAIIELLVSKHNYRTNSEVLRLDNGDFAQVITK